MSVPLRRVCAAFAVLACAAASPRATSSLVLLNVPTIKGSVTTKGYEGWIGLQSYSVGVTVPAPRTGGGGGAGGKPVASLLQISKPVDETSPLFAQAYFSGKPFAGATKLYVVLQNAPDTTAPVQIELRDVVVESDSTAAGGNAPNETISLSYDAIQYCAPPVTGTQLICKSYNFKLNTPTFP
jgi:type VI protein secretion system component Hcp